MPSFSLFFRLLSRYLNSTLQCNHMYFPHVQSHVFSICALSHSLMGILISPSSSGAYWPLRSPERVLWANSLGWGPPKGLIYPRSHSYQGYPRPKKEVHMSSRDRSLPQWGMCPPSWLSLGPALLWQETGHVHRAFLGLQIECTCLALSANIYK